jgi:hypothetical protein
MARTKLPAVKRREYTVEEYNALFHAGQKGGRKRGGRGGREEEFRERKLHGGTHVLWKSRPGWFDMAAIRVATRPLRRRLCTTGCVAICLGRRAIPPTRWKKLNDAFGEGWEADFKTGSPSHLEAKWDARLVEVKAWVVRHRRYPGQNKTSAERSLYDWLYNNLPGKKSHTPDRWKKLNDAFGEGWEADFETRSPSHREAKWDARLVQVKAWVVDIAAIRVRKTSAETSMNRWLYNNLPGKKELYPRSLEEAERCVWGGVGGQCLCEGRSSASTGNEWNPVL